MLELKLSWNCSHVPSDVLFLPKAIFTHPNWDTSQLRIKSFNAFPLPLNRVKNPLLWLVKPYLVWMSQLLSKMSSQFTCLSPIMFALCLSQANWMETTSFLLPNLFFSLPFLSPCLFFCFPLKMFIINTIEHWLVVTDETKDLAKKHIVSKFPLECLCFLPSVAADWNLSDDSSSGFRMGLVALKWSLYLILD